MRKSSERLMLAVGAILFGAGLIVPWWPLSLLGVLTYAVIGRWFIALVLALFLDLVFGTPTNLWRHILFPFVFVALAVALMRAFLARHVRDRSVY